jgi:Na+-transporting methylmalonyl-CoA/oxaloacetate decarboxylase beta subunit
MTEFQKRIVFSIVAILLVMLAVPEAAKIVIGNFAIGWVIADISQWIFKDRN